jgi:hypothetical protein
MTVIEPTTVQPRVSEDIDVLVIDETMMRAPTRRGAERGGIAWLVSPGLGAATHVPLPTGRPPMRIRLRIRSLGETHVREWDRQGVNAAGDPVYCLAGDSAVSFPGVASRVPGVGVRAR